MASLKPQKPDLFHGRRDAVAINTWLYQGEMYLNFMQVANHQIALDAVTRVSFASTLFKGFSAQWWYILAKSGQAPVEWDAFVAKVRLEFIPQDSVDRARDKLRSLRQKTSVLAYLNEFRNTVMVIPRISEDEKLDKFVSGLKPDVHLEVRKSRPADFESAAQVALTIDSALFSSVMYNRSNYGGGSSTGPVPMDIGNVEGKRSKRDGSSRQVGIRTWWSKQKIHDYQNGLCFLCHKKGCRASNHEDGDRVVSNVSATSNGSDSKSEN